MPREEGDEAEGGAHDEEWDEKLDPGSGKMYYFNKTTQETTWNKPVGYKGNTKDDSENNPANWTEVDDPSTGNKYYHNSVTNETSWTKPACLESPAEDDAAAEEAPAVAPAAAPAAAEEAEEESPPAAADEAPAGTEEDTAEKLAALKAMKLTDEEEEELAAGGEGGAAEEGGIADYADYTAKSAGNAAAGVPTASSVGYEARALLDQVTDKVTTAEIQATISGLTFTEYAEKNFNYDRKGLFGTKTTTDKITSWKGDRALIKTSLCSLNDKDLQGEAVQCFRNVTGFMGDRNTNKNNMDHCYKLLNNMLQVSSNAAARRSTMRQHAAPATTPLPATRNPQPSLTLALLLPVDGRPAERGLLPDLQADQKEPQRREHSRGLAAHDYLPGVLPAGRLAQGLPDGVLQREYRPG